MKRNTLIYKIFCASVAFLLAFSCAAFFAAAQEVTEEPAGVIFYDANELNAIMGGRNNTAVGEVVDDKTGVSALRFSPTGDLSDPIVNFDIPGEISADEYKFVAVIAKKKSQYSDMQIFFKTEKSPRPTESASKRAKYNPNNKWQILVFEMSDLPEWSGKLNTVRFDYFTYASSAEDYCDMAGLLLGRSEAEVVSAACAFFAEKLGAVARFADFNEIDVGYFSSAYQTSVGLERGNIIYEAKGSPKGQPFDPQATWKVEEYCAYKGIAPIYANDFSYIVIRHKTEAVNEPQQTFEIFYQAGDRYKAQGGYSAQKKYTPKGEWEALTLDFSKCPEWTGVVHSLRLDWSNNFIPDTDGKMEISEFTFFADSKLAARYSDIINNIVIMAVEREEENSEETTWSDMEDGTLDVGTFVEEDFETEETTEETLPDFIETTEDITEELTEDITEESAKETSEKASEEITEEESESKGKPVNPAIPSLPGEPDKTEPGSQAPFVIACVILALLSVASIVTVIVIRKRNK